MPAAIVPLLKSVAKGTQMKTNRKKSTEKVYTHEGAVAQKVSPELELRRTLMTCLLWEDTFYESGSSVASRLAELVPNVRPDRVAQLAYEARTDMQLRHAPLFVLRELARVEGAGAVVKSALAQTIQRADELSEFVAMYWKDKRQPLSAGVKKGLALAFRKFSAYQLAKYNRSEAVKLRDVLFLCHAKPKDEEQARVWKKLVDGTLESPDTWEVALSAGGNKKEVFERLLREEKLGGLAVLRNLRNMVQAGVDEQLIRTRLNKGIERALPFRFVVAAKHAPRLEADIDTAMLSAMSQLPKLSGTTVLVVDVSGSMGGCLSGKSEATRVDAAAGLAILVRSVCERAIIYATAGNDYRQTHATAEVPARQGLAMADAINKAKEKLGGGGIFLKQCMDFIANDTNAREDNKFDRVIVLTDEQDCDHKCNPMSAQKLGNVNYIVNMAAYKYGVGYGNGWVHVDGWSERILDYIRLIEQEDELLPKNL